MTGDRGNTSESANARVSPRDDAFGWDCHHIEHGARPGLFQRLMSARLPSRW